MLNKVHHMEFVLALCYFLAFANDIVEKTHIFFHAIFLGRKGVHAI